MSWLVPKLNRRVQVLKPIQTPNDEGGFDFDSESAVLLKTIWMGISPVGYKGTGIKYIRGKQVNENVTHEFIARYLSLANIGQEFSIAFSIGFKSMGSINPLKADYFLFLQNGSTTKGRLFRVDSVVNTNEKDEYLSIAAEEIEEHGTGYPA